MFSTQCNKVITLAEVTERISDISNGLSNGSYVQKRDCRAIVSCIQVDVDSHVSAWLQ